MNLEPAQSNSTLGDRRVLLRLTLDEATELLTAMGEVIGPLAKKSASGDKDAAKGFASVRNVTRKLMDALGGLA